MTEHVQEPTTAEVDRSIAQVAFGAGSLAPAIIQDETSLEVLMLGWMDAEALRRSLTSGRVTFWSRSRQEYWRKGDTSGHRQYVRSVAFDCDQDTILVKVNQVGAACHTGTPSCFTDRQVPALILEHDDIED